MSKEEAKYDIVVVDYSTKAEVEPLATITTRKVISFATKNIIHRFGVPRKL